MCERRLIRRAAGIAMAMAFVSAPRLYAQATRSDEARLDSLAHLAAAADSQLQAYKDSVAAVEGNRDTIMAGPVRLVVSRSIAPLVLAARDSALRHLEPAFGILTAERARVTFDVYQQNFQRAPAYVAFATLDSLGHRGGSFGQERTVGDVMLGIESVVTSALTDARGDQLRAWLGGSLPIDSAGQQRLARERLELASAPARAARECYEGSVAACEQAFALVAVRDPLTELYDAASRRLYVREHAPYWSEEARPAIRRCQAGDDSTCLRILRGTFGYENILPTDLHSGLMQTALSIGGRGAYARLVGHASDPRHALAAVSGVSSDSVLAVWHARVIGARAPSSTLTGGMAAASLFWMLLCTGFGARSSRWR